MKINLKTASKANRTTFDRSSFHLTTLDFGRTIVSNILPVNPNDSVHVNLNQFFRLSPLAVPTFGNLKIVTRAFFVPFRIICPNWQNFYRQSQDASASKILPSCTNKQLVDWFTSAENHCTELGSANNFDFAIGNQYYVFTQKGRNLYQVLTGLGYSINFTGSDTTSFDLMPILAFCRVMYDWLYPSRFIETQSIYVIFQFDAFDPSTDLTEVLEAFSTLSQTFFDDDFFINSWSKFNSPFTSDKVTISDVSYPSNNVTSDSDRVKYTINQSTPAQNATHTGVLTSFGLNLLQAVSDAVTRLNVTGYRFLDYIKGQLGFDTKPMAHDFSTFIKSFVHNANLMDVTNMSASGDGILGEMAGKGYIDGNGQFSYDVKEHGYILFITQMLPSVGYYQGRKPWTIKKNSVFDYYNPAFDSIGNEAIRNDYLFADFDNTQDYTNAQSYGGKPSGVFGFAPRYAFEFKTGHDFVSGDFRLKTRNTGLSSFHTMRVIPTPNIKNPLANNASFRSVNSDFDRIFSTSFDGSERGDHVVGYFNFDIKVSSHMCSISESLPLFNKQGIDCEVNQA